MNANQTAKVSFWLTVFGSAYQLGAYLSGATEAEMMRITVFLLITVILLLLARDRSLVK